MNLNRLKMLVQYFIDGKVWDDNPQYVSIIVLEAYFKKVCNEFSLKSRVYIEHISKLLNMTIDYVQLGPVLTVSCHPKHSLLGTPNFYIYISSRGISYSTRGVNNTDIKIDNILTNDIKTSEYRQVLGTLDTIFNSFNSNHGFDVFFAPNISQDKDLSFYIRIDDSELCHEKTFECLKNKEHITINYNCNEAKELLNEDLFGKIYASLRVDVSFFPKEMQEEIRNMAFATQARLNEEQQKEMETFKALQISRIMKAYELMKEALELLNNAKSDIGFDKISLDNINQIFFKNGGVLNKDGAKEIEDVFRNNMILRMLDLRYLDLTNADIRGMDFSGTNIHIDPQIIFSKDMSYVNATDVKFYPFSDSFNDVILDGAIINDYEANIHLNMLKSYNADTHITNEVVSVIR